MVECPRCKKKLTKENTRILSNSLGAPRPYCKECAFDKNWKIRLNIQGVPPVKLKTSLLMHKINLIISIIAIVVLDIFLYKSLIALVIVDIILIIFILTILIRHSNLKKIEKQLK